MCATRVSIGRDHLLAPTIFALLRCVRRKAEWYFRFFCFHSNYFFFPKKCLVRRRGGKAVVEQEKRNYIRAHQATGFFFSAAHLQGKHYLALSVALTTTTGNQKQPSSNVISLS